jgi:hypothetical protein
MEGVAIGHTFERGPSKDHSRKVWSKLAQWFLRKRIKCEKLTTDDDMPKFELYNHNDELFNMYYRIFYEL